MMEAMSLLVPLTAQSQQQSNTPRRMDEPFPLKLHSLLEDVENTPQADILSWDPDGRSFTIYQPKVFAETIMGQYFRQTKYKSFQRQMNLYGRFSFVSSVCDAIENGFLVVYSVGLEECFVCSCAFLPLLFNPLGFAREVRGKIRGVCK